MPVGYALDVASIFPDIRHFFQAIIAHLRKIQAAAEQPGFFGDLRRTIVASGRSVGELSAGIGVDQRLLSDFRAGNAELPAAALERLIDMLSLRLMQEIPR